MFEMMLRIESR